MKVYIVNQEPLEVSQSEAEQIITSLRNGVEYIVVNGEYVKATVITGVRNSNGRELPRSLMGALPAGKMDSFFEDKRSTPGKGYDKYLKMKEKLLR